MARSTIRKSVPVFAKKRGRGQKKDAFGVGSVSKIKSRAVQLVGKVVRRPVSTGRWGGVHFFDPVLLIARKNLFYLFLPLRVDSLQIVKFEDESFFLFFFCQAELIFVSRWSLCWSSLVQIFKMLGFRLGIIG